MSENLDSAAKSAVSETEAQQEPQSEPKPETEAENGTETSSEETQEDAAKSFVWGDGLSLSVSAGEMRASVEVALEHAENYQAEDILKYLADNNVVHGVDESAVRTLFEEKAFNKSVDVAFGTQPVKGKDGYIDWQIDLTILDGAALVEKGGRVDWKEMHHVLPVKQGQLLARLVAPTEGTEGYNVYGKELPANPGAPSKLPAGKGVVLNSAGDEMSAEVVGVVCREGDKISVSQTYNVTGDVDLKTGNVRFDGTILISGNVLADFTLYSGQDIHIDGIVEGARVEAEGNVYIKSGIQGAQKAVIKAGGDVVAKFVNNATIMAGGNIVVQSSITQSNVKANGKVLVEDAKSVIAGGHVSSEVEVSSAFIGAEIGTKTTITLGENLNDVVAQKHECEAKSKAIEENLKKMSHTLEQLNKLRNVGKLTEKNEALRLRITRTVMQLKGQDKTLEQSTQNLQKDIEEGRKKVKGVIAREVAWGGALIQILGEKYAVKHRSSKVIFALSGNEVKEFGFKENSGGSGAPAEKPAEGSST